MRGTTTRPRSAMPLVGDGSGSPFPAAPQKQELHPVQHGGNRLQGVWRRRTSQEGELGGDGRGGRAVAPPPTPWVACPGRGERQPGLSELRRPWMRGAGARTTGELRRHARARPPSSRPRGSAQAARERLRRRRQVPGAAGVCGMSGHHSPERSSRGERDKNEGGACHQFFYRVARSSVRGRTLVRTSVIERFRSSYK
jgi:hypothetical protein